MKRVVFALAAVLGAPWSISLATAAAQGEANQPCGLKQLASLDITNLPDGGMAIPVEINGAQQKMELSLSAALSYVLYSYATSMNFKESSMPGGITLNPAGGIADKLVTIPMLKLGAATGKDVQLLRVAHSKLEDTGVVGSIGLQTLEAFDVEIDMVNGKVKLFTKDHCPGKVVYWSNTYAAVPFEIDQDGFVSFTSTLDGVELKTVLNASFPRARMTRGTAIKLFHWPVPASTGGENAAPDGAPFKHLQLGGISIANPGIDILPDMHANECNPHARLTQYHVVLRCFGGSDLALGRSELKALHLYFAFGEKVLYVTPASATANVPPKQ